MAETIGRALKKRRNNKQDAPPNLPQEIIDEILLLLPARSILRFRAVCRSWAAKLSSPPFTDAYASARRTSTHKKFVVFAPSPSSPRRSTAVYSCRSSQDGGDADPLFTIDGLRTDFLSLSGRPLRGLVLFSDVGTRGRYWVCNPSTGECVALPQPRRNRDLSGSSAGLAFDDKATEWKVVHLFFENRAGIKCEVCTLGDDPAAASGCQWRPATGTGLGSPQSLTQQNISLSLITEKAVTKVPPVFADGCLHWMRFYGCRRGRDAILRFSAADESVSFVSAPGGVPWEDYKRLEERFPVVPVHLAELKGSLCMVHDLRYRQGGQGGAPAGSLDIWVRRRDRNVGQEWSLDYRIPVVTPLVARDVHRPRFITVLGCCYDDKEEEEKLLLATSEHKVFALATSTGHVETAFSVGETSVGPQREAPAALWLGLYEDSLVRVGATESSHRHLEEKRALAAVTEVLLRLPLRSIVQSKLVCRAWRTLIEGESFVAAHTTSMMKNKRPAKRRILLVAGNDGRVRRSFFNFAPLESWTTTVRASPPDDLLVTGGKVICSKPCYGLNLISSSTDDYLCNPCTGAIQCLGVRGRSRFVPASSRRRQVQPTSRGRGHAFTVGRNVGFGFDRSTGEHVAVEIGYHSCTGAPACVIKTSQSDAWTCVGTPPMSVTDMPPAHVDGTLYWMGEEAATPDDDQQLAVVAFDVAARAFDVLRCQQQPGLNIVGASSFLVELNNTLSLVVTDREAEGMEIWTMNDVKLRTTTWVKVHRVRLRGQPDFSPGNPGRVVVPLDIGDDGRILLSTGRALGYYDAETGAVDTIYSLDRLQLPPHSLAFPVLCEDSLVPLRDEDDDEDEYGRIVAPPPPPSVASGCDHPEHRDDNENSSSRPVIAECQNDGCHGIVDFYSLCCKRLVCCECMKHRCARHYKGHHLPLNSFPLDQEIEKIRSNGVPVEHPLVPDPDYYCHYYSVRDYADADVVRHVFVSLKDFARSKLLCHLMECAYRMDGHGNVRDAWACRYRGFDAGGGPMQH